MAVEVGIWRIDQVLQRVDFGHLDLEGRLQDILDRDISVAAPNWMVIGREVPTQTGGRIDILAMDSDGGIIVVEIKRDRTPREIVAQVLDYGSWARTLSSDDIARIFSEYIAQHHPDRGTQSLDEAYKKRFGLDALPDELNESHELVIVASTLDASSERIVKYLSEEYGVAINVVFFRVFKEGEREYLTRAWLTDPIAEPAILPKAASAREWNGEFYVSFGEGEHRNWSDAQKYGFVSAGGKVWHTGTLGMLEPDDRIWVNIPNKGYVGVGRVEATVVPAADFRFKGADGKERELAELPLSAPKMLNPEHDEHVVKVRWIKTVPASQAVKEKGFFGIQHTVARPRVPKWGHTIDRLKKRFEITDDGTNSS